MALKTIVLTIVFFIIGASITGLILHCLKSDHPTLALVVGAILSTQVGIIAFHLQPGSTCSLKVKAQLGGVVAGTCLVFSLVMQVIANFFPDPVISIPISAIGSFIFPFVLFNIMWNSMQKNKNTCDKKA